MSSELLLTLWNSSIAVRWTMNEVSTVIASYNMSKVYSYIIKIQLHDDVSRHR